MWSPLRCGRRHLRCGRDRHGHLVMTTLSRSSLSMSPRGCGRSCCHCRDRHHHSIEVAATWSAWSGKTRSTCCRKRSKSSARPSCRSCGRWHPSTHHSRYRWPTRHREEYSHQVSGPQVHQADDNGPEILSQRLAGNYGNSHFYGRHWRSHQSRSSCD